MLIVAAALPDVVIKRSSSNGFNGSRERRCDGAKVQCDGPMVRRACSEVRGQGPSHHRTGPSHHRTGPSHSRTLAPSHRKYAEITTVAYQTLRILTREVYSRADRNGRWLRCFDVAH